MIKKISTDIQIVILAGGKGTRLEIVNNGLPKSLTPVLSIPIIEHQINYCRSQGFKKFLIILCYKSDKILKYFKDNPIHDIEIKFFVETQPMGTAGALIACRELLQDFFLVVYSDTYFTIDLKKFTNNFIKGKYEKNNILGQILVHPNNHPFDSDLVELNDENILINIHGYPHPSNEEYSNLVNAACYLFSKELIFQVMKNVDTDSFLDIAKDIFPIVLSRNIKILGYQTAEFIKDMGTPERLKKLEDTLNSGKLKNLGPNNPKNVVFVDRDGCINKEIGRITNENDLELIDGSAKAILNFNNASIPVICITNQPVIARGDIDMKKLDQIHARLDFLLGSEGAFIDRLYYCPHHPDKGFEGEVSEYKIDCNCRKPNIGMIFQAADENIINLGKSWLIGDSSTDIAAAQKCGLRSVLLLTGYGGSDLKENVKPNYIFEDLLDASNWIINDYQFLKKHIYSNLEKFLKEKLILISGPSRVGKTNISQLIKEVLEEIGHNCYVISADSWLKSSLDKKNFCNINEFYEMSGIESFINNCLNKNFPIYQKNKLLINDKKNFIETSEIIHHKSFIIVEGTPISYFFKKYIKGTFKVFVNTNNEKMTARLKKKHQRESKTEKEINNNLHELKLKNEVLNFNISKYKEFSDFDILN